MISFYSFTNMKLLPASPYKWHLCGVVQSEYCEAKPETGPCRASLRHWYYNRETGNCEMFMYGGCRGNKNNYLTRESCMQTCTGERHMHISWGYLHRWEIQDPHLSGRWKSVRWRVCLPQCPSFHPLRNPQIRTPQTTRVRNETHPCCSMSPDCGWS